MSDSHRSFWQLSAHVDDLIASGENNPVTIMALLLELRDCAQKLWSDEVNSTFRAHELTEQVAALQAGLDAIHNNAAVAASLLDMAAAARQSAVIGNYQDLFDDPNNKD